MTSPEHPGVGGKHCTKCGNWKPWGGFNRCKRDADRGGAGYVEWCKDCKRKYREANRDQIAEQKRNHYEANRDRILHKHRKYRKKNHDQIAVQRRTYYEANRDRILQKQRNYRLTNSVDIATRKRSRRSYYTSLESARKARKRSLPSEAVILREIALRDGATCWMCGDELSEWSPAHLDHLVPLSANADQLVAWGVENPGTVRANMSLACPSCNMRKSNRLMLCALARYFRNLSAESESLDEAC